MTQRRKVFCWNKRPGELDRMINGSRLFFFRAPKLCGSFKRWHPHFRAQSPHSNPSGLWLADECHSVSARWATRDAACRFIQRALCQPAGVFISQCLSQFDLASQHETSSSSCSVSLRRCTEGLVVLPHWKLSSNMREDLCQSQLSRENWLIYDGVFVFLV